MRIAVLMVASTLTAADWSQFRGPNGTGVSSTSRMPAEFGPDKNVAWKTAIPFGHSSPIIVGDTIFITVTSFTHPIDGNHYSGVADNCLYWRFVVVTWLPIAALVYLGPRLL